MTYILPPLNALRAFEAAARHLSFKLAAHKLHVTPAAVGQQVKALEARLGVQLFERSSRGLSPTPRALALQPELEQLMRSLRSLLARHSCNSLTRLRRRFRNRCPACPQKLPSGSG